MTNLRSSPNWPSFLWHHRVHTEKRNERLFYWRVAFEGGYDRDAVSGGIENACRKCEVNGIIVYELFGAYDVLIRAWLPSNHSFEELDTALRKELEPVDVGECEWFEVDCMVRHWPFTGEDGSVNAPEDRWLSHLQDSEIEEVETKWPDVNPDLLERLVDEHLIAPTGDTDPDRPGIKFAIEVTSNVAADVRTLAELEQQLVEILGRADAIRQRSLYSGNGFAHFLIMGRVEYEHFHAVHSDLISQINAAAVSETFQTRTLTHVSGQRGYRIAREGLSGESRPRGVGAFLQRHLAPRKDSDFMLEPGEDFGGRFEIIRYLGRGGFASVYAANDRLEGVKRALKIFKSPNREAALREMSALRRINHPNVVKAIWGDHEGPLWYLVTEFVEGKSLDECERGDDVWSLSVMIETLRGLEAVHPDDARIEELRGREELSLKELAELQALQDNGLVHRDIKPENIMVGDDGHVTIVDFNIASPARKPGKTRSGTPEYMAPDAGYDGWEPADDLFSCGVVLYELLLGTHPFPNRQPVAGVEPIDPLGMRPDLPLHLVQVLLRACNTLRAERFQSAGELRDALEGVRDRLEGLEEEVRLALWEWQRQQTQPEAAAVPPGEPPRTEEPIRFARILIDRLEDSPFESDGESPAPQAAGDGSGNRLGEDPDEHDEDDEEGGDEDDEQGGEGGAVETLS